jgi:hypothetical protein
MRIFQVQTLVIFCLSILAFTFSELADAKKNSVASRNLKSIRAPSQVGLDKALEVRGQSRNLSMMLVLKNRKENIDFVHPREHYQNEIRATIY